MALVLKYIPTIPLKTNGTRMSLSLSKIHVCHFSIIVQGYNWRNNQNNWSH